MQAKPPAPQAETTLQRLHVFLAHAGVASRRKAEAMIAQGLVRVNKAVAQIGQKIDPTKDRVTIHGSVISPATDDHAYFLINKPRGIVSTTADELGRKNVLSLVPTQEERLYPVGRLDMDSEGLMLLTTDGELTHTLTHPRFEIEKTYHVLVEGTPTYKALNHLRRGVRLKEGYTKPAEVEELERTQQGTWLSITIHEGRNRQIRRMLERVGYDTVRLIRVTFGPFSLDQLEGEPFRELEADAVHALLKSKSSANH